jgi:hypothetical protein
MNMNNYPIDQHSARRLGALEELFWLYDQTSPMHFAVTAEIEGLTDVDDWQRALSDLQRRHPMMALGIDPMTRSFRQVADAPIPLRVISEETNWIDELRREIATPFLAAGAPLIRAALMHRTDRAILILIAHHSISDGLSLTLAVHDLLQLLSGVSLPRFSQIDAQEAAFGYPALPPAPALSCDRERAALDPLPAVEAIRLTSDETATIVEKCRERGASVQAVLCNAVARAGRSLTAAWTGPVTFNSPVSTRVWSGAAEQCSLSVAASLLTFAPDETGDFWAEAIKTRGDLRLAQSRDAVAAGLGAVHQLISMNLDVTAMAAFMEEHFLIEGMISNLGVIPFGSSFGSLRLTGLWGPTTLVVGPHSQTIGALTFGGSLHLTHTSREPIPGLLEKTRETLMQHCAA